MTSSVILDLGKKLELNLQKAGFEGIPVAAVRLAVDKSGSMHSLYRQGFVQKAVELFMGAAAKFDDNGELEYVFFNDETDNMKTVSVDDYLNLKIPSPDYGTRYVPPLNELWGKEAKSGGFWPFGKKEVTQNTTPTFIGFVTDGDPSDRSEFIKFLENNERTNTFVQFIVIGTSVSQAIKSAMENYDNTQMYLIPNPMTINADDLYQSMATPKLANWFKLNKK